MARFQPPGSFDFADQTGWQDWLDRFTQYRLVVKLHKEDNDVQIATLLYSMGPQANVVFKQLVFDTDADKADYDKVVEKLTGHFRPVSNIVHERAMFERAVQNPSESVDEFLRRLHRIADKCAFDDARDDRIRDRFMANLLDAQLTLELQLLDKPDLAKAATHARNHEQVRQQVAKQRQKLPLAQQAASADGIQSKTEPPHSSSKCHWCGYSPSHPRSECPARRETCSKCGRDGHYSTVCLSRAKGNTRPSTGQGRTRYRQPSAAHSVAPTAAAPKSRGQQQDSFFLGCVGRTTQPDPPDGPWMREVRIGSTPVTFKVDTGADTSVITAETYAALTPKPTLLAPTAALQGPDGSALSIAGRFVVQSRALDGELFEHDINVLSGTGANLLSRQASYRMGYVRPGIAGVSATAKSTEPLGCMDGPPVHIRLRPDATPYHCPVARRVPFPLLQKVKGELARMVDAGIIEPVTEPTEWCAPMVTVRKKNGDVRICVDLKKLNGSVQREAFVLPTVDETMAKLAGATVFSTLDTKKGFWQVPLAEDSQHLTTFITPFGRFKFLRLPFGISSAPEIFQRRLMGILDGIPGVCIFMDDILIFGSSVKEHDIALRRVEGALQAAHVTLNPDKSQLRQPSIRFLGHVISSAGVRPDPERVAALRSLPAPTDVASLRRVLGLFNYLHKFLPDMANISSPMRALLRHDTAWLWDAAQQAAFDKLKMLASQACSLSFFDPARPAVISADASSYGLGATLLQRQGDDMVPIAYASKSLNDTQQRYAQIEKELLAVTWACEHFAQYLLGGQPVTVQTDHKPLVPLINTRDLDNVPLRCQRMLMRLLQYHASAVYVPGPRLVVADTLSRAPTGPCDPLPHTSDLLSDVDVLVASVATDHASPAFQTRLQAATAADATLSEVSHNVLHGWPGRERDIAHPLRSFFAARLGLSVADGCVYYNTRLVIPASMQAEVLRTLHDGHQGITKCRARARSAVWWPGLDAQIADMVSNCEVCSKERPTGTAPLQPQSLPDRPWQRVASDLFQWNNQDFLLTIDYFSKFIEVDHLRSTTSSAIITALSAHFARHGIPEVFVSDNGPQYASHAFAVFLARQGIEHRTSSPHHPQSNGMAERAVRTIKSMLSKSQDCNEALLAYRSTPLQCGSSPAQLLMGRQIRSSVPSTPAQLEPAWPDLTLVRQREAGTKDQQAANFNARHAVRPPPNFNVTDRVWIIDLGREGKIKERITDRSYIVSSSGSNLRRNIKSLRPLPDPAMDDDHLEPPDNADSTADNPDCPVAVNPDPLPQPVNQPDQPGDPEPPALATQNPVAPAQLPEETTTRSGRVVKSLDRLNL